MALIFYKYFIVFTISSFEFY